MEEKMISMSESVFDKLTVVGEKIGQLTMAVRHYQELKPLMGYYICLNTERS